MILGLIFEKWKHNNKSSFNGVANDLMVVIMKTCLSILTNYRNSFAIFLWINKPKLNLIAWTTNFLQFWNIAIVKLLMQNWKVSLNIFFMEIIYDHLPSENLKAKDETYMSSITSIYFIPVSHSLYYEWKKLFHIYKVICM